MIQAVPPVPPVPSIPNVPVPPMQMIPDQDPNIPPLMMVQSENIQI